MQRAAGAAPPTRTALPGPARQYMSITGSRVRDQRVRGERTRPERREERGERREERGARRQLSLNEKFPLFFFLHVSLNTTCCDNRRRGVNRRLVIAALSGTTAGK